MDVDFRYLDLNGQRLPLEGHHRQEGESRTGATVGAVLAAGVIGGMFVKGKGARIAEGREFTARTIEAIPVSLSGAEGSMALFAPGYTPQRVSMDVPTKKERKAMAKAEKAKKDKPSRRTTS